MRISTKLQGMPRVQKAFKDLEDEVDRELEKETDRTLINIQRGAKNRAPVDHGVLKSSIQRERNGLDGKVVANAHYAPYVEFGTGNMVSVPDELIELAEQFKGRGIRQVNLPARPFLYPAFVEERKKHLQRLKKKLR